MSDAGRRRERVVNQMNLVTIRCAEFCVTNQSPIAEPKRKTRLSTERADYSIVWFELNRIGKSLDRSRETFHAPLVNKLCSVEMTLSEITSFWLFAYRDESIPGNSRITAGVQNAPINSYLEET